MVKSKYLNPCILIMIVLIIAVVVSMFISMANYNRMDSLIAHQLDQRIPVFDFKLDEFRQMIIKIMEEQQAEIATLRGQVAKLENGVVME